MNIQQEPISAEDKKKIINQLIEETVIRITSALIIWAIASVVYGFQSFDLIQKEIPNLTLWENLWPRLIFNFAPAILFAIWYKKGKQSNTYKKFKSLLIRPPLYPLTLPPAFHA